MKKYNFIKTKEQYDALFPAKNQPEEIIDYLLANGPTPEPILKQKFEYYLLRCSELNRGLGIVQVVHDTASDMVFLSRSSRIKTTDLYKHAYPNSNGKYEKGGNFKAPKSFFRI